MGEAGVRSCIDMIDECMVLNVYPIFSLKFLGKSTAALDSSHLCRGVCWFRLCCGVPQQGGQQQKAFRFLARKVRTGH